MGPPLRPQTVESLEVFVTEAIGNFRYLTTTPWNPWTTPNNMVSMDYNTTTTVLDRGQIHENKGCRRTGPWTDE